MTQTQKCGCIYDDIRNHGVSFALGVHPPRNWPAGFHIHNGGTGDLIVKPCATHLPEYERQEPPVTDVLNFVHESESHDASREWQALDVLAAEVRHLRRERNLFAPAGEAAELRIVQLGEDLAAERALNYAASLRDAQEVIARVEALPAEWRQYADGFDREPEHATVAALTIARVRRGCADELDAALRGEP